MELTPVEVRILGCLIEKQRTTPDQYPLSSNALRMACNQKTSREPVVDYDDRTIDQTMLALRQAGMARTISGGRTNKHRQVLDEKWGLDNGELSVLGVIMLRGPQTVPELLSRTDRMHGFESGEQVRTVLASLRDRPEPFVINIGRASGQREDRWAHLLESEDFDAESVTQMTSQISVAPQQSAAPSMAAPTPSSFIRSASAPDPSSEPLGDQAQVVNAAPSAMDGHSYETVQPADRDAESVQAAEPAHEVSESNGASSPSSPGAGPDVIGAEALRIGELEADLNALRSEFDQLERRFDKLCEALGEDI